MFYNVSWILQNLCIYQFNLYDNPVREVLVVLL